MTVPKRDTVQFQSRDYMIFWALGGDLFNPNDMGIKTALWTTACRHGYVCNYTVDDGKLQLMALDMVLEIGSGVKLLAPIRILGTDPNEWYAYGRNPVIRAQYSDIRGHVPYTGSMIIVQNFIMGSELPRLECPVYGYKEVHELVFREGRFDSSKDCSEIIAEVRREDAYREMNKVISNKCRPGMDLIEKYSQVSRDD